ncbi:hypothetical protein E9840_03360 [Tissierella creatinini]|nr:hypothetical protein E9840_03360 [Tissierella creatinini]TJX60142.1 hypothetical protein E8P77_20405 [Soehngenia saccharolytica]
MKNTRVDVKASTITVVFYILTIGVLFLSMYFEEKVSRTFMFQYHFAAFFTKALGWIVLGGLIAFLGGRPKGSKKTIILELITIGIPSLLMTFVFFIYYFVPPIIRASISGFVGNNLTDITLIGGILLGCEIYRLVNVIRRR